MKKIKFFGALMTKLKNIVKKAETVINTSFIQERFGTQHGEMLDSIDAPF